MNSQELLAQRLGLEQHRQFRRGVRRRVRENSRQTVRFKVRFDGREDLGFDVGPLGSDLPNNVCPFEFAVIPRIAGPASQRLGVFGAHLRLLDLLFPHAVQSALGTIQGSLIDIQEKDFVISFLQQVDGDPLPHRPRANDRHTPNLIDPPHCRFN